MKNNQGIVKYYYTWKKDRVGGSTIASHNTALNAMEKTDNTQDSFEDMKRSLTIPRVDGDTVSMMLRVILMHYQAISSILIYFFHLISRLLHWLTKCKLPHC